MRHAFAPFLRATLAVALLGSVAACAAIPQPGDEAAPAEAQAAQAAGPQDCGAASFQSLVGTSVGQLDASILPENRRVIFPGMMVTQDFQPQRLNVDVGTDDRITRIYCG